MSPTSLRSSIDRDDETNFKHEHEESSEWDQVSINGCDLAQRTICLLSHGTRFTARNHLSVQKYFFYFKLIFPKHEGSLYHKLNNATKTGLNPLHFCQTRTDTYRQLHLTNQ